MVNSTKSWFESATQLVRNVWTNDGEADTKQQQSPTGPKKSSSQTGSEKKNGSPDTGRSAESETVTSESQKIKELRQERDELAEELSEKETTLREKNRRLRDLEGSLAELQGVVEANAEGDLTRRAEVKSDVEAVVAFVSTYNRMLDEWNTTLKKVKQFSTEVDQATTETGAEIEAVRDESEQVTESVGQIADGADRQNKNLEEISQEMSTLSATIEEVAASANEVANISERAVNRGDESQEAATTAVERLEEMSEKTTETMAHIESLQERVSDIEEIAEFINDVAEETNMLALNANIEAARAGEKGDGFGVVANEVKQLASETKEATDRIEQSVTDVQNQTERTVSDMRETSEAVKESREAVTTVVDGLDEVVGTIEEVNQNIKEVDSATDEQARSTQEVSGMVEDVSAISEETTEEAQTVSEAASSQHEALTEVSEEVAEISDRAEELGQTSREFETGKRDRRVIRDSDTVIRFHHAMTGLKSLLLQDMAEQFEQQTDGIRLQPISMGSYPAALESVLDTADDADIPALTQVYDIGTARARASGSFQTVENLISTDVIDTLVESVRGYYEMDGSLHSVPFNSSNPILCLNRNAFEQAGLDPDTPPETLDDLTTVCEQLVADSDCEYGLSFAIYSWFVEQWFGEAGQLLINAENGRNGTPTEANLDSEFGNELFEWWVAMEEDGLYHNPGIHGHSAALNAFHNEEAAMFIGSTSSLNRIEAGTDFPLETAYYPVLGERNGVLVGGASLWVKDDLDPQVESALGEFLTWLLQPEQQAMWHKETGYFPVVEGAITQLESSGWFEENPRFATAFRQFQESTDSPATNGAQMKPFTDVRSIIHEGRAAMETTADVSSTLAEMNDEIELLLGE